VEHESAAVKETADAFFDHVKISESSDIVEKPQPLSPVPTATTIADISLEKESIGSLNVNLDTTNVDDGGSAVLSKQTTSKLLKKTSVASKKTGAKKLVSSDVKLESFETVDRRAAKAAVQTTQENVTTSRLMVDESGTGATVKLIEPIFIYANVLTISTIIFPWNR